MLRRLSSVLTLFWKFIFPALWFAGSGLITLLSFTESQGFTRRDGWVSLACWPFGFFLCFILQSFRLKRVRIDGDFLYLSNYLRQAEVPLCDVWSVGLLTVRLPFTEGLGELALKPFVVVEFQGQTPFGNRIVFMARGVTVPPEQWTHPVVSEIRQAVDRALLGSATTEQFAPRDLGRAREAALEARARLSVPPTTPSKPTLRLQERYLRRHGLLLHFFTFPGLFFLVGLALAVPGARAATVNFFAEGRTLATGASAAVLIGFALFLGSYFVGCLIFWPFARTRLVPYFEQSLNSTTQKAFQQGFALAKEFDGLERRASQLGVTPLSAFGFGDDMLGQVVVWHDASDGLETLRALVASSRQRTLDPNLLEDLQTLEAALEKAEVAAVRFSFVVRLGSENGIQNVELCQRKGSFW